MIRGYRDVLVGVVDVFRVIPRSWGDRKAADCIVEDGIHILIDLNGHTGKFSVHLIAHSLCVV